MEILRRQSHAVVIAGVAVPNPESESFHRIMGFGRVGVHERIGFKFGGWHSVAFFQKVLKPHEEIEVESPIRFERLLNQGELKDLLTSHQGENPLPLT